MNRMTLLKAIGNIDDKYIEEAVYIKDKEINLINIDQNKQVKTVRKKTFKQYIPACLAAAAALVLLIVGVRLIRPVNNDDNEVMVANPMQTVATMAEAENITGFGLDAPEVILEAELKEITVISGDTIQVDYYKDDEVAVSVRKAKGTEDISGDYNEYESTETIELSGKTVTIKKDQNQVYLVNWTDGGYTYSLSIINGADESAVFKIVEDIF